MEKLLAWLLLLFFIPCCNRVIFKQWYAKQIAPEISRARFATSKGNFEIQIQRGWSPKGADRLYSLIRHHYFDRVLFLRVEANFLVEFENLDTVLNNHWNSYKVPDEPVIQKNEKGTISFASGSPDTRSTWVFINLNNNSPYLDTFYHTGVKGNPPVAFVTKGMNVVESLYKGYDGNTFRVPDSVWSKADAKQYFKKKFPRLDYIKKA